MHPKVDTLGERRISVARAVLVVLSVLVLALVLGACDGGSGEPTTAATPSAPGSTTLSPTAEAEGEPGDGGGLDAPQVVKELTPSVVHVLSEAGTLDVVGQ